MPVNVDVVDRRTIRIEFPADPSALVKVFKNIPVDMAIVSGAEITDNEQSDPRVVGIRLVAERAPEPAPDDGETPR